MHFVDRSDQTAIRTAVLDDTFTDLTGLFSLRLTLMRYESGAFILAHWFCFHSLVIIDRDKFVNLSQ
jgi:hypothetical protein